MNPRSDSINLQRLREILNEYPITTNLEPGDAILEAHVILFLVEETTKNEDICGVWEGVDAVRRAAISGVKFLLIFQYDIQFLKFTWFLHTCPIDYIFDLRCVCLAEYLRQHAVNEVVHPRPIEEDIFVSLMVVPIRIDGVCCFWRTVELDRLHHNSMAFSVHSPIISAVFLLLGCLMQIVGEIDKWSIVLAPVLLIV